MRHEVIDLVQNHTKTAQSPLRVERKVREEMFKEEEARKQHIEALLQHPVAAMVSMIMTGDTSSLIAAGKSGASSAGSIEVKILQSVMQHVSWPPPPESAFLSGFDGSEVCMFTVSWLQACTYVLLSGNVGKDVQGAVDRDIRGRLALGVLRALFDISNARSNHVSSMGLDEMLKFASLEHQYGVGEGKLVKEESDGEVQNRIISLCERIIAAHPPSPAVLVQDRKGDLPLHILCSDPQGVQVGCVLVWATHKNNSQQSLSLSLSLSHTHTPNSGA
jgi:hypothetical protein